MRLAPGPRPHKDRPGPGFHLPAKPTHSTDKVGKRGEIMIDDVASIEKVEADLNRFIETRARGAKDGRSRANEEEAFWRENAARHSAAARLVNARAWAEYFGGLALASHDAAARYAEKRDRTLALVRKLEDGHEGGTAA